jgi:hypothetical protein
MGGSQKRSKKQSDGKLSARQRQRDESVYYLDENFSDCRPIHDVLDSAGLQYERHLAHFPRDKFPEGVDDEIWLPFVGQRRWIVLTKDKAQRYTPLELDQIKKHSIRQFSFSSGNMNKAKMADILKARLRDMFRFAFKHHAPFIAAITQHGVYMRFPKESDRPAAGAEKPVQVEKLR